VSDKTTIEWTDSTWNPIRGCSKVDLDCRNCYAESVAARFSGPGLPYHGTVDERGKWNGQIRLVPEHLADPLRWQRPRRIFVNSMSDLFHDGVPDEYIAAVFGVMAASPRHTFQLLTKRPERAAKWFQWAQLDRGCPVAAWAINHAVIAMERDIPPQQPLAMWPLPNVWIGTSVGHAGALHRIDQLRSVPASVRFLSLEPLHGRLSKLDLTGIHWVIVGGESGKDARPMHPDWAREVRDQCVAAGVPFFFKQWGEWAPVTASLNEPDFDRLHRFDDGTAVGRVGKKSAGRKLDGRTWDEYPVTP